MIGVTPPISLGGSGVSEHNNLTGRQGGTLEESFHVSESQHASLMELIYKNNLSTFTVSPNSGERGVLTALSLTYNILANDDVFTAASIDQGIGSILADVNGGAKTISGGSSIGSKPFVMDLAYNRNGVPTTESKSTGYFSYIPQFMGVSASADLLTYAAMSTDLLKYIQFSPAINRVVTATAQYVYFISIKNNAKIYDQNNFQQTIGNWSDGVSEFYRKSIVLTLANGVNTETVYVYRTRNVKSLTAFAYRIE